MASLYSFVHMHVHKCFPYKTRMILNLLQKINYFILYHYIVPEKQCALFKYETNHCSIVSSVICIIHIISLILLN